MSFVARPAPPEALPRTADDGQGPPPPPRDARPPAPPPRDAEPAEDFKAPEPEPEPKPEAAADTAEAAVPPAAHIPHSMAELNNLPICHKDGCCFGYCETASHLRYKEQIVGCISTHKEEEKVGIMYFRSEDKGCSSFGRAHHVFESWCAAASTPPSSSSSLRPLPAAD